MSLIKVLVVDDSAFMRQLITDFLNSHPRLQVIAKARNGEEALRKIEQYKPDVITLDVELPDMNGLEVLRKVMARSPVPTVMLSSQTQRGAQTTFEAMSIGAVDFVSKPSGTISLDLFKVKNELIDKVLHASEANIFGLFVENEGIQGNERELSKYTPFLSNEKKVVCIGTSTGGPRALQEVLTRLPKDMPAPVLIVQHMPAKFTHSLAVRLDGLSQITVKEAAEGDILENGVAYIAPGGFHMRVDFTGRDAVVRLDLTPPINGHRPSVDIMFESVATARDYSVISVIMTGMGSDGTQGLRTLKKAGHVFAIAESQETAIIYGMPKAAINSLLIDEISHLEGIATSIVNHL